MPDGENSFYNNMKYGKKFYTYIADELVDYTRRIFKLSQKREKTFICGLSMGGYGAVRTALKKPEQYAAAASLSGCLDIVHSVETCSWKNEAAAIWGDNYKTDLVGTDADLFWLIKSFPDNAPRPRIYSACGTQDVLYGDNIRFRDLMDTVGQEKGFDFRYEEGEGVHNWEFWNKWVVPAIDYMLD
jgi:S-formylglutathione hydrolase FrmB